MPTSRYLDRCTSELARADAVAFAMPVLRELVWVLANGYKIASPEIAATVERLIGSMIVIVNRPAAEAALAMLRAGGDFADGAIAYEGSWLGADSFVSFDCKAVKLLRAQGKAARMPERA